MSRSRIAAAIAIPVLLALGLAFTFLQGRHPAGEATPTTAAPSSSIPPPPTTSKPNPPKATGEDWLAIMSDILTYRHYLYEHPQPNLLSQIYDKRCPCFAQERNTLADLQRRGLKYTDQGVKVISAKLLGRGTGRPASVALDVVERVFAQVLVDRNGKIVQKRAGSAARTTTYELVQGEDSRWRVSFVIPR
ncbi:MAG TPA: hypothetical protein VFA45_07155 [Actinomycetes bacterium]|nr:hypothetical protein [Actinomycetes bacterium]